MISLSPVDEMICDILYNDCVILSIDLPIILVKKYCDRLMLRTASKRSIGISILLSSASKEKLDDLRDFFVLSLGFRCTSR